MSLAYFVSDIHLSQDRPDITSAFLSFLSEQAPASEKLYVLGDLFEVWIGDDNNNPFIQSVIDGFKGLADKGTQIYFLHGNRDFLIGERFAKQAGLTLLPEQVVIDINGESVLLCHGDELCTLDEHYQAYRNKVRSAEWQSAIMAKPLWIRKLIGRYARLRSYIKYRTKPMEIGDVVQSSVVEIMQKYQITKMIHGHTHRPAKHQFELDGVNYERIVLGDWYSQSSILLCENRQQQLLSTKL